VRPQSMSPVPTGSAASRAGSGERSGAGQGWAGFVSGRGVFGCIRISTCKLHTSETPGRGASSSSSPHVEKFYGSFAASRAGYRSGELVWRGGGGGGPGAAVTSQGRPIAVCARPSRRLGEVFDARNFWLTRIWQPPVVEVSGWSLLVLMLVLVRVELD
jgi:hypothetical protein